MYEYHVTVVTPVPDSEPLAYSMAPRTVPTLVSRFANSLPPEQNDTALIPSVSTWRGLDTNPSLSTQLGN